MIKFYRSDDRYTAIDTENRTYGFSANSEALAIVELVKYPIPLPSQQLYLLILLTYLIKMQLLGIFNHLLYFQSLKKQILLTF